MKSQNSSYLYKFVNLVAFTSFVFLLVFSFTASSVETPFEYESDKIEPGTMYYYKLFANSQASRPKKKQFYYIKSSGKQFTTIKVLNIEL